MKFKKILMVFLCTITLFVPMLAKAEEENKTETAAEKSEVKVYLFRGEGCSFCAAALSFFESIEEEYGDYFELVKYEVWSNQENNELMQKVAEYTGVDADGVPYIVIGDQVFPGYDTQYDESIKEKIVEEYEKEEIDRVDTVQLATNAKEEDNSVISSFIVVIVVGGIVAAIIFARKS